MARRESLRAYQNGLLRQMEQARSSEGDELSLLFGFRAGGHRFLIDGQDVIELVDVSMVQPMPASKPWAVGIANIKGSVFSITDFSVFVGGERIRRGKFVVLNHALMPSSALLIEGLTGLFESKDVVPATDARPMAPMPNWVTGCHLAGGERHYMIDGALLVADPRFSKLQSGELQ